MRRDFDQPARFFESLHVFTRYAFETAGNATVTTTCQGTVSIAPNQARAIDRESTADSTATDGADRRQMRATSFALCNAETAFGVGQIGIPLG